MDLKWQPPLRDGGSPITGYIVEKREKGSPRWVKAAEVKGPDCKARAEDLDEGTEYEFRVIALNDAGPSEPSQPSKSVTPKPRKSKRNKLCEVFKQNKKEKKWIRLVLTVNSVPKIRCADQKILCFLG